MVPAALSITAKESHYLDKNRFIVSPPCASIFQSVIYHSSGNYRYAALYSSTLDFGTMLPPVAQAMCVDCAKVRSVIPLHSQ